MKPKFFTLHKGACYDKEKEGKNPIASFSRIRSQNHASSLRYLVLLISAVTSGDGPIVIVAVIQDSKSLIITRGVSTFHSLGSCKKLPFRANDDFVNKCPNHAGSPFACFCCATQDKAVDVPFDN